MLHIGSILELQMCRRRIFCKEWRRDVWALQNFFSQASPWNSWQKLGPIDNPCLHHLFVHNIDIQSKKSLSNVPTWKVSNFLLNNLFRIISIVLFTGTLVNKDETSKLTMYSSWLIFVSDMMFTKSKVSLIINSLFERPGFIISSKYWASLWV